MAGKGLARCLAVLSVGASTWAFPHEAQAFRTTSDLEDFSHAGPVVWAGSAASFVLGPHLPAGLTPNELTQAIQQAFQVWNTVPCSQFQFRFRGQTQAPARHGDGLNTIEWVNDWGGLALAGSDAAGVTDLSYVRHPDGSINIVEADIYLNAQHYTWVEFPDRDSDARDVLSVLVHEAGHALGLLHTCEPNQADGAPECSATIPTDPETMFPLYASGQDSLTADDEAGVCSLYPNPRTPSNPQSGDGGATQDPQTNSGGDRNGECDSLDCGVTTLGHRPLGDPCERGNDCDSGVCLNGFCSRRCSKDSDCASDSACKAGVCEGTNESGLGESCKSPDSCLGAQCLRGLSESPVCTRACGEGLVVCPAGWACDAADGQQVCVPSRSSGGCSLGTSSSQHAPRVPLLGAAVLTLGLVTRWLRVRHRPRANFKPAKPGT